MDELNLNQLMEQLQSDDPNVRTDAWQSASTVGAQALKPLAKLMVEGELEVGRAAKRGMWKIVRTAGAPGHDAYRKDAERELIGLIANDQPNSVRREVFWMLSEIGGNNTVDAIRDIEGILNNEALRDDARCCVQRIPTQYAVDTLREALEEAPREAQLLIAQALRKRGVQVSEEQYPCQKLVPTKKTKVKPVGR